MFQQVLTRTVGLRRLRDAEPERRLSVRRAAPRRSAASAWRRAATSATTIAVFEATHGTAPKYAGKDMVNPGSVILSGEMMLRYLGWGEAADLIESGARDGTILEKKVTYDLARQMEGATELKTSEFADAVDREYVEGIEVSQVSKLTSVTRSTE